TLIADDLVALDADERRDVAEPAQMLGPVLADELAVGEDLKVAIRVRLEQLKELGVHEGLAADDAEEDIAHGAGLADHAMERGRRHGLHLGGDVDPAALAAQVAAIDDRDVQKRRKDLAAFDAGLVPLQR